MAWWQFSVGSLLAAKFCWSLLSASKPALTLFLARGLRPIEQDVSGNCC